jgi:protein-L-isoaspartate O-methyltransferase
MAGERTMVPNGYHSYYADMGRPAAGASPEALQLWALLSDKSEEEQRADELRQRIEGLQFSNIPGYFPTPPAVVDMMLDYAQIEPHHSVLEPSAGHGAIVERIPEDCLTVVYEINHTLCEILQLRGFDARPTDFLEESGEFKFDRVMMNPPFEKQQDIAHVLHAFGRLKPGGRLVSVMSASTFYRSNNNTTAFRQWLEDSGAEVVDLPEGSFKESGTGVNAKLVIIDKE